MPVVECGPGAGNDERSSSLEGCLSKTILLGERCCRDWSEIRWACFYPSITSCAHRGSRQRILKASPEDIIRVKNQSLATYILQFASFAFWLHRDTAKRPRLQYRQAGQRKMLSSLRSNCRCGLTPRNRARHRRVGGCWSAGRARRRNRRSAVPLDRWTSLCASLRAPCRHSCSLRCSAMRSGKVCPAGSDADAEPKVRSISTVRDG